MALKSVSFTQGAGLALSGVQIDQSDWTLRAAADPAYQLNSDLTVSVADPVAYVRGSTMQATVSFTLNPIPPSPIPSARIEGAIAGLGKFVANGVLIPAAPPWSVIVTADTALPSTTNFYNPMAVAWSLSADGTPCALNCTAIGTSSNPVYVTLATPTVAPLVSTFLQLAVGNGGASTQAAAFQQTWSQFYTGTGPANVTTWDGRSLYYYPFGVGFDSCAPSALAILTTEKGAGQCNSFAQLFEAAIAVNGIQCLTPGAPLCNNATVSIINGNLMLVKDWSFTGAGTSGNSGYPFNLVLNPLDGGAGMVFADDPTQTQYGDLTSQSTLYGQNTRPPSEKIFRFHFIVKVDPSLCPPGQGPYFDPSYGAWYDSAADFENKAIFGYAEFVGPSPGNWAAKQRQATDTLNISIVP